MIQAQFLNKILDTKDPTLITLNNLSAEFFSDYKDEFNFIKNHLEQYGNVPDKETFLNVFPDFDLMSVSEGSKYLLDALYEDRNKRLLAETFNKVREHLMRGNTEKAMQTYSEMSEKLLKAKHLEAVDIYSDIQRYDEYVDRTSNFAKYYVKTGFDELDRVIGGWDRKEELATIVARTNTGKTWALLNVIQAAAKQGLRVGLYSGEMSVNKVGYRIDTLISHISNTKMTHGNDSIQVDYKKFLEDASKELKDKIYVLTPINIGGIAGVSALRAFIEKYKLDMLCIDQHSLLEDDRGAKNPVERASNISKDLKNLQVMTGIPIISVSQQNRESTEEKGVGTQNIAQSDRIGQDSTTVIFLERKDDIMTLYLGKARDTVVGAKLNYRVNLDTGTFTFIPNENDATGGADCDGLRDEFEYDTGTQINHGQMTYGYEDDSPF